MKLERFSILSDDGGFTLDMATKNKQSNKSSNEQNLTNKRNQISINQKSHVSLQDFGEFFLNDLESMEYATSIDDILLPITPRFLHLLGLFLSSL